MGSNNCTHARTETVEVVNSEKGLLYESQIVKVKCLDCMTNGQPTFFNKEIVKGNVTGHVYSDKPIDKTTCKHAKFIVDESTIESKAEDTLEGVVLGMLTAHWFKPQRHYLIAVAKCVKCERKFLVKCYYHTERVWENYKQTEKQIRGNWEIVVNNVRQQSQTVKEEIAYV
jgi:hypothetical protein